MLMLKIYLTIHAQPLYFTTRVKEKPSAKHEGMGGGGETEWEILGGNLGPLIAWLHYCLWVFTFIILFITGFVQSNSCPVIEKQSPNKLKMDTAFLNISTDLSQPIEISGISSDCYKVGENVSHAVYISNTIWLYNTD